MAYKLQIVEKTSGINCNVRYENLSKREKPEIVAKTSNGTIVKERTVYQGTVLPPGSTQRQWIDDQGTQYSKTELTFWCGEDQVDEVSQTKVLEIVKFEPLESYTDRYVMDKFYEIFPDNNGMKKDIDRDIAIATNLSQMRKLWEHLKMGNVVARGEFNVASRGFVAGDGYIRAVEFGNKWALEIGVFKEEKIFEHLNEGIPTAPAVSSVAQKSKKLKMV